MKKFTLKNRTVVMEHPTSLHNYFGWPSVTTLQDGTLAAVASGFRLEHLCPFGKLCLSLSKNGGKTWSLPTPVIDTVLDDRDGGIMTFGESSVLVTSFNNSTDMQQYCVDTWKRENLYTPELRGYHEAYVNMVRLSGKEEQFFGATYRVSHDGGVTWGPVHVSPITSPHGPCVHGDQLLWVGTTFGDWVKPAKVKELQCWEMDGEGNMTMLSSLPGVEGQTSCEPHAISLPDGRLLVHIRMEPAFTTWQTESSDGGVTWTEPVPLGPDRAGAPAHLFLHSKGRLLSVVGYRDKPYGIRVFTSDDLGKTWEYATVTDDAFSWDLGYPAVTELPSGEVYMVWYQKEPTGESRILGGIWDPYE